MLSFALTTFFLLTSVFFALPASGKDLPPGNISLTKVQSRKEKHFDRDRDGFLNLYERLSLQTHLSRGYPLVSKKTQKPYDFDRDLMLQPFEESQYLADKKNGRLGRVYAKYKSDLKKTDQALKGRPEKIRAANGL